MELVNAIADLVAKATALLDKNDALISELARTANVCASWTKEIVSISNDKPTEIKAVENQMWIKIIPLTDGGYFCGPDSDVSSKNAPETTKANHFYSNIRASVFTIKSIAPAGTVVVLRGIK